VELGLPQRLREVGQDPRLPGLAGLPPHPRGREKYQPGRGDGGVGLYLAGELQAVHPGHLLVQDRHVVALAPFGGPAQLLQRLECILGLAVLHAPGDYLLVHDLAVRLVIVYYQHAHAAQAVPAAPVGSRLR
jgi:hypothetical protein